MAKPELGTKRVCPETTKKFYDLNRDPIVSPYTGQSYPLSFFEASEPVAMPEEEEEVAVTADEEDTDVVAADADTVSLEEADAEKTSEETIPDMDDDALVLTDDDDEDNPFLSTDDDDDDDDVSGLIVNTREGSDDE